MAPFQEGGIMKLYLRRIQGRPITFVRGESRSGRGGFCDRGHRSIPSVTRGGRQASGSHAGAISSATGLKKEPQPRSARGRLGGKEKKVQIL